MITGGEFFPLNPQLQIVLLIALILMLILIIVLLINRRSFQKAGKIFIENEEKFKAINSSILDAIIMTDETGSICFWNKAAERIFGYTAEETSGKALNEYIISPPANSVSGYIANDLNTSSVTNSLEFSALKKDGTVFPIELTFSNVEIQKRIHSAIIIRDITQRKRKEDNQNEIIPGNECILLIDDEYDVLMIINNALKHLGYNVTCISDSVKALDEFKNNPDKFDLVITDMAMPNMNGRELAVELLGIRPNIPVIIITGYSDELSRSSLKSLGVKNVLYKRILINDLSTAIRDALRTA